MLGLLYILSTDLILELLEQSKHSTCFFLEDVYITGILMAVIQNVTHKYILDHFYFASWGEDPILEHYKMDDKVRLFFTTVRKSSMIETLWNLATDRWKKS